MDLEKDISLNYVNKHKQYDKETKIKILKEYKENNLSVSEILKKYNISASCFYRWRNIFEKEGESGFIEKSRKPKTTPFEITDEMKEAMEKARLRDAERYPKGKEAGINENKNNFMAYDQDQSFFITTEFPIGIL